MKINEWQAVFPPLSIRRVAATRHCDYELEIGKFEFYC